MVFIISTTKLSIFTFISDEVRKVQLVCKTEKMNSMYKTYLKRPITALWFHECNLLYGDYRHVSATHVAISGW